MCVQTQTLNFHFFPKNEIFKVKILEILVNFKQIHDVQFVEHISGIYYIKTGIVFNIRFLAL